MDVLRTALCWLTAFAVVFQEAEAAEARFVRAINLNGPALTIDGRSWEGTNATNFAASGKTFENQRVVLRPPTDSARSQMIRSSYWGSKVDLTFSNVAPGSYQLFLYVWEDNHSEKFKLSVNGASVVDEFHSGSAGMWKRLGPWKAEPAKGQITISAQSASHGAANLSGVELWIGDGPVPGSKAPEFISELTAEQTAFFESKIRPVLADQCYECHSARAKKIKGGFVLDSRAGLQRGGDTGPAITPGDPEASLLIHAVRHQSEDLAMPPRRKLPPEQIAALEEWVRMGAPDPRSESTVATSQSKQSVDWVKAREWWSFRPLVSATPPKVKDSKWPANEIDRFILARIEQAGLRPAPDADKRTLLRRVTYDLTGLPPTPGELKDFLDDRTPTAFEKVVDRLLASPAYGERWGRHWLDVVRYADTAGDNSDFPVPQMRRYRDWVISAHNRDLPFDQFVREQLAGDLLPAKSFEQQKEQIIATGYIANSRRFGSRVEDYPQHLTIEDTIDNLGRAFLGVTINCARCHDHKFDPITAQDYYALYGIFHSTRYPWPGIELEQKQRDFVPLVPKEEMKAALKALSERQKKQAELDKAVNKLEEDLKKKTGEEKKPVEDELANAKEAAKKHAKEKPPVETAYAVAEGKRFENVALQLKGDPAKPGPVVQRRFLSVFGGRALADAEKSSGRLDLANWIIEDSRPLVARVAVNRIWQNHFGRGLVATPNDFGRQGKPPTHPELLDWLATTFIADGWSVKKMHRRILLSHAWRQSVIRSEQGLSKDPANDLLSSFPRQRLDAESIRDTLLLVGGSLDRSPGGDHPFPPEPEWKFTQHNPFRAVYDTKKRSVYLMTQRIQRHPYLAIFDGADPSTSTPRRLSSTTPLQALFLLNDPLVHDQAEQFAARLLKSEKADAARLELAWETLFARLPDSNESKQALDFLGKVRDRGADSRADTAALTRPAGNVAGLVADSERVMRVSTKTALDPDAERRAWTALIRSLFRLNEFIYLD